MLLFSLFNISWCIITCPTFGSYPHWNAFNDWTNISIKLWIDNADEMLKAYSLWILNAELKKTRDNTCCKYSLERPCDSSLCWKQCKNYSNVLANWSQREDSCLKTLVCAATLSWVFWLFSATDPKVNRIIIGKLELATFDTHESSWSILLITTCIIMSTKGRDLHNSL